MHSFTLSLRHQLAGTPVQVIEIIPPAVDSDLGGPGLHTFGVPIDEFLDVAVPRIEAGEADVAHGFAQILHDETASRPDPIFTGFLCTSYGRNPGSDGNPAGQLRWRRNAWRKRP